MEHSIRYQSCHPEPIEAPRMRLIEERRRGLAWIILAGSCLSFILLVMCFIIGPAALISNLLEK